MIPAVAIQDGFYFGWIRRGQQTVSARFIVKRSPKIRIPKIGLIAGNFAAVRYALRSKLHTRIHLRTDQFEFDFQFEIAKFLRCAQKLILRGWIFQIAATDGTIFDSEQIPISLPAFKRFSVEKRNRALFSESFR